MTDNYPPEREIEEIEAERASMDEPQAMTVTDLIDPYSWYSGWDEGHKQGLKEAADEIERLTVANQKMTLALVRIDYEAKCDWCADIAKSVLPDALEPKP